MAESCLPTRGTAFTMDLRTKKILAALALLAVAAGGTWLAYRGPAPSRYVPPRRDGADRSVQPVGPAPARRYRPGGPLPAQAIPGGSLAVHEGGEDGGHTLARHVGRTADQLRERLQGDPELREVSTFPDLATAERIVARTLYEKRRDIQRWLDAGAKGDQMGYVSSLDEVAGQVLKAGAAEPVPGRTVFLVLQPSTRFPEGFSIRAAFVRLP